MEHRALARRQSSVRTRPRSLRVALVLGVSAGVLALAAPAAQSASAVGKYPVSTSVSGLYEPWWNAIDQSTHNLYVTSRSNTVQVIDESGDANTGTVTSVIPVGIQPSGMAVDQYTHDLYVANDVSDTVSVIDESGDAHTGTVTATISVGSFPYGVAVDQSTHNVYVANRDSDTVSVIDESGDVNTGKVTSVIPVGMDPI